MPKHVRPPDDAAANDRARPRRQLSDYQSRVTELRRQRKRLAERYRRFHTGGRAEPLQRQHRQRRRAERERPHPQPPQRRGEETPPEIETGESEERWQTPARGEERPAPPGDSGETAEARRAERKLLQDGARHSAEALHRARGGQRTPTMFICMMLAAELYGKSNRLYDFPPSEIEATFARAFATQFGESSETPATKPHTATQQAESFIERLAARIETTDEPSQYVISRPEQIIGITHIVYEQLTGHSKDWCDLCIEIATRLQPLTGLACRSGASKSFLPEADTQRQIATGMLHEIIAQCERIVLATQRQPQITRELREASDQAQLLETYRRIRQWTRETGVKPPRGSSSGSTYQSSSATPSATLAAIGHSPQPGTEPRCNHCIARGRTGRNHAIAECRMYNHAEGFAASRREEFIEYVRAQKAKGRRDGDERTPFSRFRRGKDKRRQSQDRESSGFDKQKSPIIAAISSKIESTAGKRAPAPRIAVTIDGRLSSALLDTGAQMSAISSELAENLGLISQPLDQRSNIQTADGADIRAVGRTTARVSLATMSSSERTLNFVIIRGLVYPVIFGHDALTTFQLTLAYGHGVSENQMSNEPVIKVGQRRVLPDYASETTEDPALAAILSTPLESAFSKAEERLEQRAKTGSAIYLPPELTSGFQPIVTGLPEWRPPGGADRDSYKVAQASIHTDFAREYPTETQRIKKSMHENRHAIGGLKLPDCDPVPPISRLEAMSIALYPQADIQRIRTACIALSPRDRVIVLKQASDMVAAGRLQPSHAAGLAHAFVVHEQRGNQPAKERTVVGYGLLNDATLAVHHPLPIIAELQQELARYKIFGKGDLWSAFYQIPLADNARPWTACNFAGRILEFLVVPMGVRNAPSHLSRVLRAVLEHSDPLGQWIVRVYCDDVLIAAMSAEAFAAAVIFVMERATEHHLTFAAPKFELGVLEIQAVGSIVSHGRIAPTTKRCEAIANYGQPVTYAELHSFLGMIDQIAPHVYQHAPNTYELTELLKRKSEGAAKRIEWAEQTEQAFLEAREAAAEPQHLTPFDETRQPYIGVDAAGKRGGGGWYGYRNSDNTIDLVDAFNHKWSPAELNYPIVHREGAILRMAVDRWYHHVVGRTTVVLSDNAAIVSLLRGARASPNARLRAMAAEMQGLDLIVVHVAGSDNHAADALSRDPGFEAAQHDDEQQPGWRPESRLPHFEPTVTRELRVRNLDELSTEERRSFERASAVLGPRQAAQHRKRQKPEPELKRAQSSATMALLHEEPPLTQSSAIVAPLQQQLSDIESGERPSGTTTELTQPQTQSSAVGAPLQQQRPEAEAEPDKSDAYQLRVQISEAQSADRSLAPAFAAARDEKLADTASPQARRRYETYKRLQVFTEAVEDTHQLLMIPQPSPQTGQASQDQQLQSPCVIVPDGFKTECIVGAHLCTGSHLGSSAMTRYLIASKKLYWVGMYTDVRSAVAACPLCARERARRQPPPNYLGDVESGRSVQRFAEWELDSYEPGTALTPDRQRVFVLVVCERFSGLKFSKVLPNHYAESVYVAITDLIIRPFRTPLVVYVDQGKEFYGDFERAAHSAGIEIVRGLVANHRFVGRLERHNRTCNERLRRMAIQRSADGSLQPAGSADELQQWIDISDRANNIMPSSTGYSPHELAFGFKPAWEVPSILPPGVVDTLESSGVRAAIKYADLIRLHRAALSVGSAARNELREERRAASERANEARSDRSTQPLERGDLVLARAPQHLRPTAGDKVAAKMDWTGPWTVENVDEGTSRVQLNLVLPGPALQPSPAKRWDGASSASSAIARDPIRTDYRITVHSTDTRRFHEGYPVDSNAPLGLSPLHMATGLSVDTEPWNDADSWNSPFQPVFVNSDYDRAAAHIKRIVNQMLTNEMQREASERINAAIAKYRERCARAYQAHFEKGRHQQAERRRQARAAVSAQERAARRRQAQERRRRRQPLVPRLPGFRSFQTLEHSRR